MNFKSMVSGLLVMSLLTSVYPSTRVHAEVQTNDETANILLEMKVMKEMSASILDLQQKIGTGVALSAQINSLSGQENQLTDQLNHLSSNPTADVLQQNRQLSNQLSQVRELLQTARMQSVRLSSLDEMKAKLARDQRDYDIRKNWLNQSDKKELEKYEIELRIDSIQKKEAELKSLKAKLEKREDQGGEYGIFSGLLTGLVSTLFVISPVADRWRKLNTSPETSEIAVYPTMIAILAISVATGFKVHSLFVKDLKRQIDEKGAKLEASKRNLELLLEAKSLTD